MTVIAIANQKGGVAKTTTTINLGYALVQRGKKTLLIDLDPQSSLSLNCGLLPIQIRELEQQKKTLYYGMVDSDQDATPLSDLIMETEAGYHLIPSSIRLSKAELELQSSVYTSSPMVLRTKMAELRELYDFILIDCPPSLGLLTANGLSAADGVLIPTKTDAMSTLGIHLIWDSIAQVRKSANPQIQVVGLLPTMFNKGFNEDKETLEEITELGKRMKVKVFDPINRSTQYDKSVREGKSTLESRSDTQGVENYHKIADKLINYGKRTAA